MFDINWDILRIFLVAARELSFRAAAQATSESGTTISRRITDLENQLGVPLFHRTKQGITLTPAGRALVKLATRMEFEVQSIKTLVAEEKGLTGVIKLHVSEGVGGYWLPQKLEEFHSLYPAVTVDVTCTNEPPPIGTPEVDIALSWHQPTHPDAVKLAPGQMILMPCASKEYLKIHGTPTSLGELSRHRLCDHSHFPKTDEWKIWSDIIASTSTISFRSSSALAVGQATVHNAGISLQPIGLAKQDPRLAILDLEGYAVRLKFWLTCHRQFKDIPRIRVFTDFIKTEFLLDDERDSAFAKHI